jgi:hypothetical protein
MATLESLLKTIVHQCNALAIASESALEDIAALRAKRQPSAEVPAKTAIPVPGPARTSTAPPPKAAPVLVPVPTEITSTRVLAGFTINPPPKGQRTALPKKGEIAKRARELGVSVEKIAEHFPKGVKPTNETKLRFLEHLDTLAPAVDTPASNGAQTLAGFTITPPNKGSRMALPTKGEITKKARELGMPADKVAAFFPKGVKPTNDTKLKILKQLDGLAQASV